MAQSYAAVLKHYIAEQDKKKRAKEKQVQQREQVISTASLIWPCLSIPFLRRLLGPDTLDAKTDFGHFGQCSRQLIVPIEGDLDLGNLSLIGERTNVCDVLLRLIWKGTWPRTPLQNHHAVTKPEELVSIIEIVRALLRNGLRDPIRLQRTFVLSAAKAPNLCLALLHLRMMKEIEFDVHAPFQETTALFMATFASNSQLVSMLLMERRTRTHPPPNTLISLKLLPIVKKETYAAKLQKEQSEVFTYHLHVITEPWQDCLYRKCSLRRVRNIEAFRWNLPSIDTPQTDRDAAEWMRPIDVCIEMLEVGLGAGKDTRLQCLQQLLPLCNENDDEMALDLERTEFLVDYDDDKVRTALDDVFYWQMRQDGMIEAKPFPITTRKGLCRWYHEKKKELGEEGLFFEKHRQNEMEQLERNWCWVQEALQYVRTRSIQERESIQEMVNESVCAGIRGVSSIVCLYLFRPLY